MNPITCGDLIDIITPAFWLSDDDKRLLWQRFERIIGEELTVNWLTADIEHALRFRDFFDWLVKVKIIQEPSPPTPR